MSTTGLGAARQPNDGNGLAVFAQGGGRDGEAIALNRRARERLAANSELVIVPGAGQLFEEPGALDEGVRPAGAWLRARLAPAGRRADG